MERYIEEKCCGNTTGKWIYYGTRVESKVVFPFSRKCEMSRNLVQFPENSRYFHIREFFCENLPDISVFAENFQLLLFPREVSQKVIKVFWFFEHFRGNYLHFFLHWMKVLHLFLWKFQNLIYNPEKLHKFSKLFTPPIPDRYWWQFCLFLFIREWKVNISRKFCYFRLFS